MQLIVSATLIFVIRAIDQHTTFRIIHCLTLMKFNDNRSQFTIPLPSLPLLYLLCVMIGPQQVV